MSSAVEKRWFSAISDTVPECVLCHRHGIQISHSNRDRGMGQKSAPWQTAALCPACHHDIDSGRDFPQAERRALHDRAITLTHDRMIRAGRLKLTS